MIINDDWCEGPEAIYSSRERLGNPIYGILLANIMVRADHEAGTLGQYPFLANFPESASSA